MPPEQYNVSINTHKHTMCQVHHRFQSQLNKRNVQMGHYMVVHRAMLWSIVGGKRAPLIRSLSKDGTVIEEVEDINFNEQVGVDLSAS